MWSFQYSILLFVNILQRDSCTSTVRVSFPACEEQEFMRQNIRLRRKSAHAPLPAPLILVPVASHVLVHAMVRSKYR